jgi:hypothetical protein
MTLTCINVTAEADARIIGCAWRRCATMNQLVSRARAER